MKLSIWITGLLTVAAVTISAIPVSAGPENGPESSRAVAQAMLPYIMQFREIRSIHFTAQIAQEGTMESGPFAGQKFSLRGRYGFWAEGARYRIDWRVRQASGAPIHREIWAFDGKRYQSVLMNGPRGTLVINHRKPHGTMGPTEPNPILANIYPFCNRNTKNRPGNWLDFGRIRQHPHAVAAIPAAIRVTQFRKEKEGPAFTFHLSGQYQRWPLKWPLKTPPPLYFRPGHRILESVELRPLPDGVMAPRWYFSPPAQRNSTGRVLRGTRYYYKGFRVSGARVIYLPIREVMVVPGKKTKVWIAITTIQVNKPINPALFDINYNLASTIYEDGKFISARPRRLLPAQLRHLGPK